MSSVSTNNAKRILSAVLINGKPWQYYGDANDLRMVESTLDANGRGTDATIVAVARIRRHYGCIVTAWAGE